MKLHLGSGRKILDGYINVDSASFSIDINALNVDQANTQFVQEDAVDYIKKLQPSSVDEVKSEHFLEHLTRTQMCRLLYHSHRALKENGIFDVLVPTLSSNTWKQDVQDLDWKQTHVLDVIYGGSEPDTWGDLHKFGYDEELLLYILSLFGFDNFEVDRDVPLGIRVLAKKKVLEKEEVEYTVYGELKHLFSNVILSGVNLADEYFVYQIENVGITKVSENADLYRRWFTIREKVTNKVVAFYDSGYYNDPNQFSDQNSVFIIPLSCQGAVGGQLDFDFNFLENGFFNAGFVSGEIRFVRKK